MKWLAVIASLVAGPALGCGIDTDCVVADRTYRISGAENAPNGALLFAHGYKGSAAGVMRNGGLKRLADELGVALIALNGVDGAWQLPNRPRNRSMTGEAEFTYVEGVLDHAARFGLNRDRVVLSGFSAGGMLTWNVACARSDLFAGFIPMSGTFWDPVPDSCPSPAASIVHIHGVTDRTVPMAGRPIADSKQGDLAEALDMYAGMGRFDETGEAVHDDLTCETSANSGLEVLNVCYFDGGHSFRLKDLRVGWHMLDVTGPN